MKTYNLVHNTESMQYNFPKPSMPDGMYEKIPSFTMQDDSIYLEEDHVQSEIDGHIMKAFMECLEEIDIKSKELFNNIVPNGHVDIPLGRLARDAIGDSRPKGFLGKIVTKVGNKMKVQKHVDFVVEKRELSIDDELSRKLERFKVKTVNIIGGIVKEDQK